MRILVTGARGFIGSYLSTELTRRGHEVVEVDRRDYDLAWPGGASWMIEETDPDYVVHLAARYGRILCADAPHEAVVDNAAATAELAACCAKSGLGLLYASSSEVYGDHGQKPISEASSLRTPTTIYGLSKRWGEEVLRLYLLEDALTIARLNMLYGPGQRAGYGCCALATFIRRAIEGQELEVHEGTSRSWLYVEDAVRALADLIQRPGTWNIGNPGPPLLNLELAQKVRDLIDPDVGIREVPCPSNQIPHKVFAVDKLEEATGWAPVVSLDEGLERTIAEAQEVGMADYQELMG